MKKTKDVRVPDLAIIREVKTTQHSQRIQNQRNENPNTFEEESKLTKGAAIYTSMQHPYMKRISASDSIEIVHNHVLKAVEETLEHKTTQTVMD